MRTARLSTLEQIQTSDPSVESTIRGRRRSTSPIDAVQVLDLHTRYSRVLQ